MLKLRDLFTPSEKAILFPDVVFNGDTLEGRSSENGPKSCRCFLPFFLSFFSSFADSSPVSSFLNLSV